MENAKTFEEKMEELDLIVSKMKSDSVSLEDMISLNDKAQKLIKELTKELEEAKAKIIENE